MFEVLRKPGVHLSVVVSTIAFRLMGKLLFKRIFVQYFEVRILKTRFVCLGLESNYLATTQNTLATAQEHEHVKNHSEPT